MPAKDEKQKNITKAHTNPCLVIPVNPHPSDRIEQAEKVKPKHIGIFVRRNS